MPNQLSTEPAQVGPSSATDEFNEPLRSDYGSNCMPMAPLADVGGLERLTELEVVIERGLTTFLDVGAALLEIRDRRLYKPEYESFESYCRARWNWGRSYVNKQIAAAEVVGLLGTAVPTPSSEAVARELAPLKDAPDEMARVWEQAVEQYGPKPTAEQTRATAVELLGPTPTAAQVRPNVRRRSTRAEPGEAHEQAEQRRQQREWNELVANFLRLGRRAGAGEFPAPAERVQRLQPSTVDELRRSIPPLLDYLGAVYAAITVAGDEVDTVVTGTDTVERCGG